MRAMPCLFHAKPHRIAARIVLIGGGLLAVLLLLEGSFRLAGLSGFHRPRTHDGAGAVLPPGASPPGVSYLYRPHARFHIRYDDNPRGYFDEDNGITYEMNNLGFRDQERFPPRRPGVKRIIVLGDSFTFGEGVHPEDMFVHRIEQMLLDAGDSVEVLNFALGGWGTVDEIAYLERCGLAFAPDLVLVAYVLNDAQYAGKLDFWEDFRQQFESSWVRHSALLSHFYMRLLQGTYVRRHVRELVRDAQAEQEKWRISFAALDKGDTLCAAHGARLAVVLLPFMYAFDDYPFLPFNRMIERHCRERSIPVRDLLPAFAGLDHEKLWVHPSDPHPNEIGHELIARELVRFLREEKLLEGVR